jgi:inosine-uridine nucleoside N-ribohydrolase
MTRIPAALLCAALLAGAPPCAPAAQKRMVVIDQDGAGPGGSNTMSMMVLLQAPQVDVLGITIVTGNAWRDDEVRHTLRMLELIGRSDVPVAPGAVFPLVRTQEETRLATPLVGQVAWLGAWGQRPDSVVSDIAGLVEPDKPRTLLGPFDTPPLPEGEPAGQPLGEDAAHFLIRQVRAHPHEVTVYAAGPLTNIALAVRLDPHFAELARGIVIMGGSLNPHTDDPEFNNSPRHEFNFWFDPEAARIVLRAHWARIDLTTVDIAIQAMYTQDMVDAIAASPHPAARYIASYSRERYYQWDEIAACAWLDPAIIKRERELYIDVDVGHGPTYGETLTWSKALKPMTDLQLVHAQLDLDLPRFRKLFIDLMSAPAPSASPPSPRP